MFDGTSGQTLLANGDVGAFGGENQTLQASRCHNTYKHKVKAFERAGSGGTSGVNAIRVFDTSALSTSVQPLYAFR